MPVAALQPERHSVDAPGHPWVRGAAGDNLQPGAVCRGVTWVGQAQPRGPVQQADTGLVGDDAPLLRPCAAAVAQVHQGAAHAATRPGDGQALAVDPQRAAGPCPPCLRGTAVACRKVDRGAAAARILP